MRKLLRMAVGLGALIAGAAQASHVASFAAFLPDSTQNLASPGSYSVNYAAPTAGAYLTSFVIVGYDTLDGANGYEDDFTLTVNGSQVFAGTFNLGGGGNSVWQKTSAVVTVSNPDAEFEDLPNAGNGGTASIVGLPISLRSGSNAIMFAYDSPSGPILNGGIGAGPQGVDDESWGIKSIEIFAVPEPATWALAPLALGLAVVARRKAN